MHVNIKNNLGVTIGTDHGQDEQDRKKDHLQLVLVIKLPVSHFRFRVSDPGEHGKIQENKKHDFKKKLKSDVIGCRGRKSPKQSPDCIRGKRQNEKSQNCSIPSRRHGIVFPAAKPEEQHAQHGNAEQVYFCKQHGSNIHNDYPLPG